MTNPAPRPGWVAPVVAEALAATVFLLLALIVSSLQGRVAAVAMAVAVYGFANLHLPRPGAGAVIRDGALVFEGVGWRAAVYVIAELVGVAGLTVVVSGRWKAVFVAGYVLSAVFVTSRRLCQEVSLSEDGVAVRTLRSRFTVPWDDAAGVTMRGRTQVLVPHGSRTRWLSLEVLGAEPYTVYRTVHHYATHPESRYELGTGRGVARTGREPLLDPIAV